MAATGLAKSSPPQAAPTGGTRCLRGRCRPGNTRPMLAAHALIRFARATGAGRAWAAANNNRNNASLPRAGD